MSKSFLQKIAAFMAVFFVGVLTASGCKGGENTSESSALPEIVVGSDYYAPYIYLDETGSFVGIDVELITEICKHIGYKARFKHIEWQEKNDLLEKVEIDCLMGSFSCTGRENDYNWTDPYMNSRQVVAVPEDSDINEIGDLKGKRVAVQSTTKPDEIFSGRAGVKMTVPELGSLNCFPNMTYIFAAINEGYVDAIAGHEVVLREYMKTSSVKLRILDEPLLEVQIGIAFYKDTHSELISKINATLRVMKNSGDMAKIVSSYGLNPYVYLVDYEKNR